MSETIEQARKILEQRLEELEAEASRLREAVAALTGSPSSSTKPPRRSRSRGAAHQARRSARAGRGERERQLLGSIERHPEYRVADHAREVGVRPQQLYPLLHKLVSGGKIAKTESGYEASAPAPAGASAGA